MARTRSAWKNVSLRIPEPIFERLQKHMGRKEHMSANSVIVEAIVEMLAAENSEGGKA